MWSSRILCLASRARPILSVSAVSPLGRHNLNPAITITDRGNSFVGVVGYSHRQSITSISMNTTGHNFNPSPPSTFSIVPDCISRPFHETRRCMSKYLSKSARKRLPLSTKRAKKGFYKGNGCTSEGRLTSKGKFIANPLKKLQLIVPDLEGFTLKPYIARSVSKTPPEKRTSRVAGA